MEGLLEEDEPVGEERAGEAVFEVLDADVVLEVAIAVTAEGDPPEVGEPLLVEGPVGHLAEGDGEGGVGADAVVEVVDDLADDGTADGFGEAHNMYIICII
jgi:hypothetical protein